MSKRQQKHVQELIAASPPVNPAEALRRNLMYAMLNEVKEVDMQDLVRVQIDKAKNGDSKAARLIIDMVQSGAVRDQQPTHMQQAIVVHGRDQQQSTTRFLSDLRRELATVIATDGPQKAAVLVPKLQAPIGLILEALNDHAWFENEADGWHVTAAGRLEALPLKQDQGV